MRKGKQFSSGKIGSEICTFIVKFILDGSNISCVIVLSELEKSLISRQFWDLKIVSKNSVKIFALMSL